MYKSYIFLLLSSLSVRIRQHTSYIQYQKSLTFHILLNIYILRVTYFTAR